MDFFLATLLLTTTYSLITHFNGIDIVQTKHYIKLHSKLYATKILHAHGWYDEHPKESLIPMNTNIAYTCQLQTTDPPLTAESQQALAKDMGFADRDAIGELIYAVCTCHPDISASTIKLSQ